jgi:hypothetical protein
MLGKTPAASLWPTPCPTASCISGEKKCFFFWEHLVKKIFIQIIVFVTFAKKCFSVLHGVSHLQKCFLFLKVDLQKNVFYTFAKMFFAEMISALGVRKKKRGFVLPNFLLDAPQGTG